MNANNDDLKILIAISAFNEERNIKIAIDDLRENFPYGEIVVFDNGSFDGTVSVSKSLGVNVVAHSINSGSSAGVFKSYILYAYYNDFDVILQFDGDAQHVASYLPTILEPIKKGEADFVIGSRFIDKAGFQSTFFRRLGIRLFSFIDSKILKQPVTDVTSGFRALNKKVIYFFARFYKHELFDPSSLLILSHFAGAKIKEVPVQMKPRIHGASEFNFFSSIGFIFSGLINITGSVLQRNEVKRLFRDNYGY
jgi:glycosyltransferase involved in cell wall biosynthesis